MSEAVPLPRARAHWATRQGLAAPLRLGIAATLLRTGWVRALGGVDPYLAVRARLPELTRAALDGDRRRVS